MAAVLDAELEQHRQICAGAELEVLGGLPALGRGQEVHHPGRDADRPDRRRARVGALRCRRLGRHRLGDPDEDVRDVRRVERGAANIGPVQDPVERRPGDAPPLRVVPDPAGIPPGIVDIRDERRSVLILPRVRLAAEIHPARLGHLGVDHRPIRPGDPVEVGVDAEVRLLPRLPREPVDVPTVAESEPSDVAQAKVPELQHLARVVGGGADPDVLRCDRLDGEPLLPHLEVHQGVAHPGREELDPLHPGPEAGLLEGVGDALSALGVRVQQPRRAEPVQPGAGQHPGEGHQQVPRDVRRSEEVCKLLVALLDEPLFQACVVRAAILLLEQSPANRLPDRALFVRGRRHFRPARHLLDHHVPPIW